MYYAYLHYFTAVAEEGNITRAAKRLFISQPALSSTIARLEKALGFPLFRRESNRIELNEAGRCFYNYTNSALAILNEGLSKARQIANRDNSRVRVVSSLGIVRHFQEDCPNKNADFSVCNTDEIISGLANGTADLGISFHPINDSRFNNRILMSGPYCIAVNTEHPLYGKASVTLSEIEPYQLFCSNLAHTYERFKSLFARENRKCKLLCLDERDVLFKAAEIGLGAVVCLPMWAVAIKPSSIDFIPISGCRERGCVSLVTLRELYYSAEIEQMISYLYGKFHENEKCLRENLKLRNFAEDCALPSRPEG